MASIAQPSRVVPCARTSTSSPSSSTSTRSSLAVKFRSLSSRRQLSRVARYSRGRTTAACAPTETHTVKGSPIPSLQGRPMVVAIPRTLVLISFRFGDDNRHESPPTRGNESPPTRGNRKPSHARQSTCHPTGKEPTEPPENHGKSTRGGDEPPTTMTDLRSAQLNESNYNNRDQQQERLQHGHQQRRRYTTTRRTRNRDNRSRTPHPHYPVHSSFRPPTHS